MALLAFIWIANMDTLISCKELHTQIDNPDWIIFDCRFSLQDKQAGQALYSTSHLPGAYYANLEGDLSAPHQPGKTGRHPLPEKATWQERVQIWGITPDTQVVLYDDAGGAYAARMWWMLRWLGHDKVAVLDGGWQAWLREGLPLHSDVPVARAHSDADYESISALSQMVAADALDGTTQLLLDARALPRYKGEIEPLDPVAGHIPGAICSEFTQNLDSQGYFKSKTDLEEKFSWLTQTDQEVICYCGSGVTAAHNILAIVHAGFSEPKLYVGSWSEWVTDSSRPIALGGE